MRRDELRSIWEDDSEYPGITVDDQGEVISVSIPVNFYRRNGRMTIQTPEGSNEPGDSPQERSSLLQALARAYRWQEQLESGEYSSISELADTHGIDLSYASRVLRLTSLAPPLVEAIVDGREPERLTLRQLAQGIPLSWDEQLARWPVNHGR